MTKRERHIKRGRQHEREERGSDRRREREREHSEREHGTGGEEREGKGLCESVQREDS